MPRIISEYEEKSGSRYRVVRYVVEIGGRRRGMLALEHSKSQDAMGVDVWVTACRDVPETILEAGSDGGDMTHRLVRWIGSLAPLTSEERAEAAS